MTEFNEGDRVVYKHTAMGSTDYDGQVGTIKRIYDGIDDPYAEVTWDVTGVVNRPPSRPFLHNLQPLPSALTAEDIDALPVGAIIRDNDGDTYKRLPNAEWSRTLSVGSETSYTWAHDTVRRLVEHYPPVTLVSSPPQPTLPATPSTVDTLRARAAALTAEADAAQKEYRTVVARADDLYDTADRARRLAGQYTLIANDLEQNS